MHGVYTFTITGRGVGWERKLTGLNRSNLPTTAMHGLAPRSRLQQFLMGRTSCCCWKQKSTHGVLREGLPAALFRSAFAESRQELIVLLMQGSPASSCRKKSLQGVLVFTIYDPLHQFSYAIFRASLRQCCMRSLGIQILVLNDS